MIQELEDEENRPLDETESLIDVWPDAFGGIILQRDLMHRYVFLPGPNPMDYLYPPTDVY